MKRVIYSGIAILAVIVAFVVVIALKMRATKPEVLIHELRAASESEREELIMKLGMARGDPVPAMIAAFEDETAGTEFRRTLLELLFRKHRRVPDERIVPVLWDALENGTPEIREAAAHGFSVYGTDDDLVKLTDSVDDPAAGVRKIVYGVLVSKRRWEDPQDGLWSEMDKEQMSGLLQRVREQVPRETNPELKLLARSVLGRQITILCEESRELLLKSDVNGAEQKLREALALDPENHQARIRLARFFLSLGQKEKGIEIARQYHAIYPIPELSAAPVIDGDPTDAVWEEAYKHDKFYLSTNPWIGKSSEGKGAMYLGYRDGMFYVAAISYEDRMDKLLFKSTSHDADVWRGDCMEIFFDPALTGQDYYQFIVNAIGGSFDAFGRDSKKNFPFEAAGTVFKDRGYWSAEFAIAADDLDGAKIEPGAVWGFSLTRTRIGPGSEACVSWPTFGNNLMSGNYALAVFEGGTP